jgi:hypothetical protein
LLKVVELPASTSNSACEAPLSCTTGRYGKNGFAEIISKQGRVKYASISFPLVLANFLAPGITEEKAQDSLENLVRHAVLGVSHS